VFNPNHQRYLMTRLYHLDESLSEALQNLEPGEDDQLHRRLVPDGTIEQRQVLRDYLAQLRFAIRRFIQVYQLPEGGTRISALKSFGVALTFAQIAVEELRPRYLAGYGALNAQETEAAERLAAELQTLLRRMGGYLARGEDGGLPKRLADLEGTREEVALLRELERIIAEQGLVELRGTLQNLIDRVASPRLEIAIFGRISAGKSSLLNWWLDQPLLPTGITPVTAVPTRIVRGEPAQGFLTTAAQRGRSLKLDEVPHYVSETGNPVTARASWNSPFKFLQSD